MVRSCCALFVLIATVACIHPFARAANILWTGGDGTWNDGAGNNSNWSPADEPDGDDVAIFNTADVVTPGAGNSVAGLTMSGGIDLDLAAFPLTVDGLTQLSGASTNLLVGAGGVLATDDLTINNQSHVLTNGGAIAITDELLVGILDINAGGVLSGYGAVDMNDVLAAATTLIVNDGAIAASRTSQFILQPPPAGTLAINALDADARIDLDGAAEGGQVVVRRNQTLDVNLPLADIFNGSISMYHETRLDMSGAWILGAGATLDIDNGAIGGLPGAPAGKATIAGASFSQNAGTITVIDADGTLQFDAPFAMNGGTLTNNGHVIFNQTATIAPAANFDMAGGADLTVEANRTVTINQSSFNLDGSGAGGTVITVNSQGQLNLNVSDYDSDAATNAFDGTLTLDNGDVSVATGDVEFVVNGVLNMHSTIVGEAVV